MAAAGPPPLIEPESVMGKLLALNRIIDSITGRIGEVRQTIMNNNAATSRLIQGIQGDINKLTNEDINKVLEQINALNANLLAKINDIGQLGEGTGIPPEQLQGLNLQQLYTKLGIPYEPSVGGGKMSRKKGGYNYSATLSNTMDSLEKTIPLSNDNLIKKDMFVKTRKKGKRHGMRSNKKHRHSRSRST